MSMLNEPDFDARKDDRPRLTLEYDVYLDWLDRESARHNLIEQEIDEEIEAMSDFLIEEVFHN